MLTLRHRLRLAGRLHAAWQAGIRREATAATECTSVYATDLNDLRRLSQLARRVQDAGWSAAGWSAAGTQVTETIRARLNQLNYQLERQLAQLGMSRPAPPVLQDWLDELDQLDAEFDSLDVVWDQECLVAVTAPITLEDLELGPFAIEFHWDRLAHQSGAGCFDIVALTPNPAASNDGVTHPHVRDKSFCAGDATLPIRQALRDGRLADALLLVRSVLQNYNQASP